MLAQCNSRSLGRALGMAVLGVVLAARPALAASGCLLTNLSAAPATHRDVNGTIGAACGGGTESGAYAGTFDIAIDGGPSTLGVCVDLKHGIHGGDCEPQSASPA